MTELPERERIAEFLARSGQVGADLLGVDWASTSLGPVDQWPHSLATVVRVLLTSRFSMWMAWGPELTFLCNDAYRRDTLGKKYPWALGKPASDVWAEIWPDIGPRIDHVLRSGESTWDQALMLILERSGYPEESYHTFSYSPLYDDDGVVAGMFCVVSEETKRVIGERRMATLGELGPRTTGMRDETEFLDTAAEILSHNTQSLPFTAVYTFDADGNARLRATTGFPDEHPAAPPIIPVGREDPIWPIHQLLEGEMQFVDVDDQARYGTLPTGFWSISPQRVLALPILQPVSPQAYGFLIVGLNPYTPYDPEYERFLELVAQHLGAGIAAARTYEAERVRAEQLEELDQAKTAFFSNVSHEFRTPLTLMLGPLQDALGGEPLADDRLELVHRNALRLLKLVNTLLDFSRAEAGRMQAEFRPTDIARLTADLAGTFREAVDRAGLELVIECANPEVPVYIDRDLWERIVLNLLSNAFKATLEGEIRVELIVLDGGVQLAVSDTGTGIAPDEMSRLFQRFHRVRGVARSYEGTGIGLALVKELTELHGGEVGVTSELGQGSRFTVTLPLGRTHLPADQVHDEPIEPAASIASLFVEEASSWINGGEREPLDASGGVSLTTPARGQPASSRMLGENARVLIADDNPDLRSYLTSLLSSSFAVETVGDGHEALARIAQSPPDLLISDVMMPGMDGYSLVGRLRSDPITRDLPIILLSARAGEEAAVEGLGAGADDYLPKPFSGRELLARVRAHVQLSALRREATRQVAEERARLEQTVHQLPAGVLVADAPDGRIVLGNAQAEEIFGHPVLHVDSSANYIEYPATHPDGRPLGPAERPMIRALRGEVVEDMDVDYVRGDGQRVNLLCNASPIWVQDEIVSAVLVFQDVSQRVRDERLIGAQRDMMTMIASGEPLERALDAMVHCLVRVSSFPARASIQLLSDDRRRLTSGATTDEQLRELLDGQTVGPDGGVCGRAAYLDETVICPDLKQDRASTALREQAARAGAGAAWAVPVRADDDELVGVMGIYYDTPRTPTEEDRRVVDLLARTAGVAIARNRDAEARARRLRELQSSLLPRALPHVPGLGAAVSFHPADRGLDVGGDFYDLFPLGGDAWGFVIGDVCGHGAEAAAVTALTRHTTRVIAHRDRSPAAVLQTVNEELRNSDHDRFCTALYGRLQPTAEGMEVCLAIGGHPWPLVRRADGTVQTLSGHGPLLGVFDDAQFAEVSVDLGPGDVLFLYTDGLVERNERVPGDAGLRAMLRSVDTSRDVDDLIDELESHALGSPNARLPDDMAIFVLKVADMPVATPQPEPEPLAA